MSNPISPLFKSPPIIRGGDINSFAFFTLKNRLPHIIEEIMSNNKLHPTAINNLKCLKNEIARGKIILLKDINSKDRASWNNCIIQYLGKSWFEVPFFFAEMYFYRRVLEALDYFNTPSGSSIDPYKTIKDRELLTITAQVEKYAYTLDKMGNTNNAEFELLPFFIMAAIWSNKVDLSQLPKTSDANKDSDPIDDGNLLLINDTSMIHDFFRTTKSLKRIDIILDNSGAELLADLALATYLLESQLAESIFLHCKKDPVFVSDATITDVKATVNFIKKGSTLQASSWANKLQLFIEQERIALCNHEFWTLPLSFQELSDELVRDLGKSNLVIIKGDANYRRLVEDRHWPISTPLKQTASYFPSNFLALRVLKSELLVGAAPELLASYNLPEDWMISGEFGIAQSLFKLPENSD